MDSNVGDEDLAALLEKELAEPIEAGVGIPVQDKGTTGNGEDQARSIDGAFLIFVSCLINLIRDSYLYRSAYVPNSLGTCPDPPVSFPILFL